MMSAKSGVKPNIFGGLGRIGPDMQPCEVVVSLSTPIVEQPTNCLGESELETKHLALVTEMDISQNLTQEIKNAVSKEDFPLVVSTNSNTQNHPGSVAVQ